MIAVRQGLVQTKAGLAFKSPKMAKGERSITIPASTVTILKRHKAEQARMRQERQAPMRTTVSWCAKKATILACQQPRGAVAKKGPSCMGSAVPRPSTLARHPGAPRQHPSRGRQRTPRARDHLDHARHLFARHPGDAGRGGRQDRRAGVRCEVVARGPHLAQDAVADSNPPPRLGPCGNLKRAKRPNRPHRPYSPGIPNTKPNSPRRPKKPR
jgi:hypothetical protein